MSQVIILNIDGPIQSWAGFSVVKTRVDTNREPGLRAVRGLLQAALGMKRDSPEPQLLSGVELTNLKTVRQGRVVRDFHTTGSQYAANTEGAKPHNSEFYEGLGAVYTKGLHSKIKGITLLQQEIIERTYLADSQFLVQVKCSTDQQTEELYRKLQNPVWSPYLGRKAFPPTFTFLLGTYSEEDALTEAMQKLEYLEQELKSYV